MKRKASGNTRIKPSKASRLSAPGLTKALSRKPFLRTAMVSSLALAALGVSFSSHAATILSGPSFTKATNAPLAGTLLLTTDTASRVSVSVSDTQGSWERNFYDYRTLHSVPLLGFKPGHDYKITVTVHDALGNTVEAAQPLEFKTDLPPTNFIPLTVLQSNPSRMEPGYTLFRGLTGISGGAYVIVVDNSGTVVWYSGLQSNYGIKQLANGDLLYPLPRVFEEVNMLGQIVRTWPLPLTLGYNHEATITERGTFLYLSDASRVVTNFPTSSTVSNAPLKTAKVWYNPVVEMSVANGQILNVWSPIDMLDPMRISYLTFTAPSTLYGWDWSHANSVIEDTLDDSIIVSLRHQNAVIKFSRLTGQLIWILGPHENWGPEFQQYLLTPVGAPFAWSYAQHAAALTPRGTLLLYDNGNFRASPFDASVPDASNYSRAVEYAIDEEQMQVSQVWEYGHNSAPRIYSDSRGSATWMSETGNILIAHADITYVNGLHPSTNAPNAPMERIIEVTHGLGDPPYGPAEVVFDLALFDYSNTNRTYTGASGYRAERIPDLYPVTTVHESVAQLISMATATGVDTDGSLVGDLLGALEAIDSEDPAIATNHLASFQSNLRTQLAPTQPELAGQLNLNAQGIIDAINNSESSWPVMVPPSVGLLTASTASGKLSLSFNGDDTRVYLIEASTDLMQWATVGIAAFKGAGQFTFEADFTSGPQFLFYRVVDPLGTIP